MSTLETAPGAALSPVTDGPLIVIALDPGKTTGYTIGTYDDELRLFVEEAMMSLVEMEELLLGFISSCSNLHIVYEDFEYRNYARTGLDLTPVKLIGIIEYLREKYEPFVKFYKQSAATGKAFWSDDKLKQHNAYKVGKRHGRDSTRHLLQWAMFGAGSQYIDFDHLQIRIVDHLE